MDFPPIEAFGDFDLQVIATIEAATAEVVNDGRARLERGVHGGGDYLKLIPTNANACTYEVLLGYPTITISGAGESATGEMFGSEAERIVELKRNVEAVIVGDVEFGHRQKRFHRWFKRTYTILYGRIGSGASATRFTRVGAEPKGAISRHTFESY